MKRFMELFHHKRDRVRERRVVRFQSVQRGHPHEEWLVMSVDSEMTSASKPHCDMSDAIVAGPVIRTGGDGLSDDDAEPIPHTVTHPLLPGSHASPHSAPISSDEAIAASVAAEAAAVASSDEAITASVAAEAAAVASSDEAVAASVEAETYVVSGAEPEGTAAVNQTESDAVVAEPAIIAVVAEPESEAQCAISSAASSQSQIVCELKISPSEDSENEEAKASDRYSVFMITCDDDQENASKLADILVRFCKSCCDYELRIHPELGLGESKLDHLRSGLAQSTYRFIFIDDGFREDDLVKFGTDAALMEMINRRDQSIIPVRAHSHIAIPPLLRMFRSLDVHKLLYGKRLDDLDVGALKETDIHQSLLESIVKMVRKSVLSSSTRSLAGEGSPRMSPQHPEVLRRHYSDLVNRMDPDHGLLGELLSAEVVSVREMENVRAEKTSYDRNEYLIKLLMKKSENDFGKFVEVLGTAGQSHIADVLSCGLASEKQSLDRY